MSSHEQQQQHIPDQQSAQQSLEEAKTNASEAKSGANNILQEKYNAAKESAGGIYKAAKDKLSHLTDETGQRVSQSPEYMAQTLNTSKEAVFGKAQQAGDELPDEQASKSDQQRKGFLQSVGDTVAQSATTLTNTLAGKSEQAKTTSEEVARQAKAKTNHTLEQAKDKANQTLEPTEANLKNLKIDADKQQQKKGFLQSVGDTVAQSAASLTNTLTGKSEHAKGASDDVAHQAKEKTNQTLEQAKSASDDVAHQAKDKTNQTLEQTEANLKNLKIDADRQLQEQKGFLQTLGDKFSQSATAAKNTVLSGGSNWRSEANQTEYQAAQRLDEAGQRVEQKTDRCANEIESKGLFQALGDQAIHSAQVVKNTLAGEANKMQDKASQDESGHKAIEAKDNTKSMVNEQVDQGKGILQSVGNRISQSAQSVKDALTSKASQVQNTVSDPSQKAQDIKEAAKERAEQTQR